MTENHLSSQPNISVSSGLKPRPKLTYNIIDRNAMKIVTLVKIANLGYEI